MKKPSAGVSASAEIPSPSTRQYLPFCPKNIKLNIAISPKKYYLKVGRNCIKKRSSGKKVLANEKSSMGVLF